MNIHVIAEVEKKIQELDVIQVLFKLSSICNVSTYKTVILKEKM